MYPLGMKPFVLNINALNDKKEDLCTFLSNCSGKKRLKMTQSQILRFSFNL